MGTETKRYGFFLELKRGTSRNVCYGDGMTSLYIIGINENRSDDLTTRATTMRMCISPSVYCECTLARCIIFWFIIIRFWMICLNALRKCLTSQPFFNYLQVKKKNVVVKCAFSFSSHSGIIRLLRLVARYTDCV